MCEICRPSLVVTHPHLMLEWDYELNVLGPEHYTYGSGAKVWWRHYKKGILHRWQSCIYNRTGKNPRGCPYCAGKKLTYEKSLAFLYPALAKQWGRRNSKGPEEYFAKSNDKVWWEQEIGGVLYEWEAQISNRAVRGDGNPYLVGKALGYGNSLADCFSGLVLEWHPTKNSSGPECYFPHSGFKVWWCHYKNGVLHEWQMRISDRVNNLQGCPFCVNQKIGYGNSLAENRPDLVLEWHPIKNSRGPDSCSVGSDYNAWWIHECRDGVVREWRAIVHNRTKEGGTNCPYCSCGPVSRVSQKWLDNLGIISDNREFLIRCSGGSFRVDGYDPETNTVYEFLGDFWHGNPVKYLSRDKNPISGKTFGSLYKSTFKRFDKLRRLGYTVKYVWESDLNNIITYQ